MYTELGLTAGTQSSELRRNTETKLDTTPPPPPGPLCTAPADQQLLA